MQNLQRLIGAIASGFRLAAILAFGGTATFAADAPQSVTLITNANLFDGSDKLVADMSVLVEGNKIAKIAKSIEHGNLLTDSTMKLLAEKGAFLSTQTGLFLGEAPADWSPEQKAKQKATRDGLDTMFAAAKKYKVKIAMGTDLVGLACGQGGTGQGALIPSPLVHPRGNPQPGHDEQRGIVGHVRTAQSLPGQTRSDRRRRLCGSPAGRWQSARESPPLR